MSVLAKSLILGMAAPGEAITKNTTVSITLVIAIVGGVIIVTSAFNNMSNRLGNLEEDMQILSNRQEVIYKAIIPNESRR